MLFYQVISAITWTKTILTNHTYCFPVYIYIVLQWMVRKIVEATDTNSRKLKL